jgi:RNA polymerase sigma-70 factor (ECF subfamily)
MRNLVSILSAPPSEADLALMAAVAAQDETAQRTLVERLSSRVRRVARLLCRSSADADDAAQLALLEILRSAQGFRVATSLERWADRITVRTTLRLKRRESIRSNLLARWVSPGSLPWGSPGVSQHQEKLGLDALLARLSAERREALVMHHALGYSVEEIAELTAAPLGTVKDRLVAARKQLRRLLERDLRRKPGARRA